MKKPLSLILAIFICLTAFYACANDTPDTSGSSASSFDEPSTAISYDEVSYFIPGGDDSSAEESQIDNSDESSESGDSSAENSADDSQPVEGDASTETSQPPVQQTGRFEIKLAKYDYNNYAEKKLGNRCEDGPYKDVSIAILDITNETNKNYSIKIHGKYLDKDGNVLKTETQEWDQFASGWQKYFLFRPGMAFDKFTYTIETKEFKGDCWKTRISYTFLKLKKDNRTVYPGTYADPKWVEGLDADVHYEFNVSKQFSLGLQYLVLFDEKGQVIGIYQIGRTDFMPRKGMGSVGVLNGHNIYFSDPDEGGKFDEWPEMFRGNVTGIYIITWIDEAGKIDDQLRSVDFKMQNTNNVL